MEAVVDAVKALIKSSEEDSGPKFFALLVDWTD